MPSETIVPSNLSEMPTTIDPGHLTDYLGTLVDGTWMGTVCTVSTYGIPMHTDITLRRTRYLRHSQAQNNTMALCEKSHHLR